MSESADKPKRKSVAFAEGTSIVDGEGKVTDGTANGVSKVPSAESHSADADKQDANVDEAADMFASLAVKKKKKKSSKEAAEEGAEDGEDKAEPADGELDLSSLKKKKKKKSKTEELEKELAGGEEGEEKSGKAEEPVVEGDPFKGTGIWQHDNSADIPYSALLSRFFSELTNRHPEIAGGVAKSYKIPPPQCLREGNKKTLLANLPDICKRLKRSDEHVIAFMFAELGTSGSVDAQRRLIIRGRFQSKQIENVLRRYVMDYVICKTCKSPDTELSRGDNRLTFMTCNSCASRRSVQAIKSGFSAQIGKRKRMRG